MTTNTNTSGRIRTSKPERYHHFRDADVEHDNGRVAAHVTAFVREGDDGQMYASFAECDSRDQFNRKRGRTIARRKWFQKNYTPVNSTKFEEVFCAGGYLECESDPCCCDVSACPAPSL